jgi:cysteine synthase A
MIAKHAGDGSREWLEWAIGRIEADFNRSSDTHLIRVDIPALDGIHLYMKDESTHPTGSLKHRLARSLFLYALCNGWITECTPIIEASSGSTAVSEAHFARLLGLRFIAVVPRATSLEKIELIQFNGGTCHFVDEPATIYEESRRLAAEIGGHFMDQFTYAERATDWRGNNNIAQSIFEQMAREPHAVPEWIVVGAGTGGTSATLGRYVRYRQHPTRICVVDPEGSVFADYHASRDPTLISGRAPCIEGIGRPAVVASFMPDVIDRVIRVEDVASLAAMRFISGWIGKACGGSTGTAIWGAAVLMDDMRRQGRKGSVVTLLCDGGERYRGTYYNDAWISEKGFDLKPPLARLRRFFESGIWDTAMVAETAG